MHSKQSIKESFSKAAVTYDAAAFLQQEIARRLDERLEMMKIEPKYLLDAGCGTGFAFPLLQTRYPAAHLLGLDLAHGMLREARRQAGDTSRLRGLLSTLFRSQPAQPALLCADFEHLPLAHNSIDLIWSSVALQWVEKPESVFREFHRALRPGGLLLFSTFGPDTLKELRAAFKGLDDHAHVNRFIDMHDLGDMLVHAGFANPVMEMEYLTLTYTDLRSLLGELRAIGAHTVLGNRRSGLMGKQAWRQFNENYERFRHEGRLPATYEVIYGHAWAGRKDRLADGRQIIEMRIAQRRSGMR